MGLRERIAIHVTHHNDNMGLCPTSVDWEAAATPDELEVEAFLFFAEGLEDAPEAGHYWVVRLATLEFSD